MELGDLMKTSQAGLDELFKKSPAGPIPEGDATGSAIVWPGTLWTRFLAWLVRAFAWKGKVFKKGPDGGATLENKITPVGVKAIVARVYHTPSWIDGKECIVLDYSKTSLLARKIRDEIRIVDEQNGIYLGKVWWGKTRLIDFALQFPRRTGVA